AKYLLPRLPRDNYRPTSKFLLLKLRVLLSHPIAYSFGLLRVSKFLLNWPLNHKECRCLSVLNLGSSHPGLALCWRSELSVFPD
ncbi:9858_t:CDS:2, partial [Ambispora gerdemannii]